jgi:PTH1 family peptidyl-tRNA hydrolase
MVADALAARAGVLWREAAEAWEAEAELGGERVLLVKPMTFMNRSGAAVERRLAEQALKPEDVVAIVDDWALPLGQLRIRRGGSHGGHNGLRSLIDTLGSDAFPRVRCGIGVSEPLDDLAGFVLAPFPPEDVLMVQEMVGQAAEAVECLVRDGVEAAMNRHNARKAG